ncbi:MAG: aminopeptidase P family protein [Rhizobiales bacterium]|nr:aminopeptidase P family protein [Hyphomicrobiales bacterium]
MFQSFDDVASSENSAERIAALRARLAELDFDGFIVPRSDEHQGEYVAAYAERLRWLTGFSGSAGLAIIMADAAAIFVDGRYTIQVTEQVDTAVMTPQHLIEAPPATWIENNLRSGQRLAYDPWLLTSSQVERFGKACRKAGAELVPAGTNPIDDIWSDQPARPAGAITAQPLQFAGKSSADKLSDIKSDLASAGANALVLTLPDSIAWAFNIRGSDVAHNPVALALAIIRQDQPAQLFMSAERIPEDARTAIEKVATIEAPGSFGHHLEQLGKDKAKVSLDAAWAPQAIAEILTDAGATVIKQTDPCILPKAVKNRVEIEGARAAHHRDGIAMVRFLTWFDREAPGGGLDEVSAATKLEGFRADTGELKEISFDSISGAGPHAAIPHYRVSVRSNLKIEPGNIYLVDSGAQYIDGTTDITRTMIVGEPSAEMKDRFTRVLKGMINLTRVRFPAGTSGGNLDVLARQALWTAGLDFDHGTGHGVGSYLSVHEGPARFSKADTTKLQAGMILSNEPGYYKQGEFGIRIENLVVVREPEDIPGGERPMHWLETLTLCPIDRRLIAAKLMTDEELAWLNAYHTRVHDELSPALDKDEAAWLKQATAEITA